MWGCLRCVEFFEGDNARLSMTRLLCFLSFFPASYVVIVTLSAETLGWYVSAYVFGYVGGKLSDCFGSNKRNGGYSNGNNGSSQS